MKVNALGCLICPAPNLVFSVSRLTSWFQPAKEFWITKMKWKTSRSDYRSMSHMIEWWNNMKMRDSSIKTQNSDGGLGDWIFKKWQEINIWIINIDEDYLNQEFLWRIKFYFKMYCSYSIENALILGAAEGLFILLWRDLAWWGDAD